MCKPGPVCLMCAMGLNCTMLTILFTILHDVKWPDAEYYPYDPPSKDDPYWDKLKVAYGFMVTAIILLLAMIIMFPIPMCCVSCRTNCGYLAVLVTFSFLIYMCLLLAAACGTAAWQIILRVVSTEAEKKTAQYYIAFIWVAWFFSLGMLVAAILCLVLKDREEKEPSHKKHHKRKPKKHHRKH